MIIQDKIKEHSCAIQPAFGYGGGGIGVNFAIMLDQTFNLDIPPVVDDDEFIDLIDPPIYLQQIDDIINQEEQSTPAQTNQGTGTVTGNNPTHPSVIQILANAVQQHIATHHAALGPVASNNGPGELSVAEMISNAIQEQLATPPFPIPGITGVIANSVELQVVASESGNLSISTGNIQQHTNVSNLSQIINNGLSNVADAAIATANYMTHTYQELPSNLNGTLMNEQHNNISSFPPDEDSNSSIPPFNAPVSSPAHLFSSNDFNASDDEGYAPSVASNIVIVDSAENSENIDEN